MYESWCKGAKANHHRLFEGAGKEWAPDVRWPRDAEKADPRCQHCSVMVFNVLYQSLSIVIIPWPVRKNDPKVRLWHASAFRKACLAKSCSLCRQRLGTTGCLAVPPAIAQQEQRRRNAGQTRLTARKAWIWWDGLFVYGLFGWFVQQSKALQL